MDKKIIGNWGEAVAKNYLENKGYAVLETNWRYHRFELDIIAYKNGVVGIEVKTRRNHTDLAFTVLKAEQLNRLRRALKAYCFLRSLDYSGSRLDLILIKNKNLTGVIGLQHFKDL